MTTGRINQVTILREGPRGGSLLGNLFPNCPRPGEGAKAEVSRSRRGSGALRTPQVPPRGGGRIPRGGRNAGTNPRCGPPCPFAFPEFPFTGIRCGGAPEATKPPAQPRHDRIGRSVRTGGHVAEDGYHRAPCP